MGLDLTHRYVFRLLTFPPPHDADALRAIPGVHVWKKQPVVTAPYNAGWVVQAMLEGRGYDMQIVPPTASATAPLEARVQCARERLQDGVFDEFLLPFQREVTLARLATDGGHVFAPAGAGKTLVSIAWALGDTNLGGVIAVTKSRARRQWTAEVARFARLTPFGLYPSAEYRKRDRFRSLDAYVEWCREEGQPPFVVMGWEGLHSYLGAILALRPTSVIFDESHKGRQKKRSSYTVELDDQGRERFIQNRLGNLSDLALELAKAVPRRLTTTASPIVNRLSDMYAQLTLVEPDGWGKTSRAFELRYCNGRPGTFGGIVQEPPGVSNTDELLGRISFMLSRVPYQVLADQLPPKRRMVTRIDPAAQTKCEPMSRTDRAAYKRDLKDLGVNIASGGSRWQKERMTEILRLDAAERKKGYIRDRVPEVLTTGKGKVLIFTGRKRACESLERTVRGVAPGVQVWMAHGDTPDHEFSEIHEAYMAHPGPCVLIGTYQAWGESLNLQDTDHMIVAMLPINPGEVEQTEGRGARLGQTRPFTIEYLIAEYTIDERLATILLDKLPAVEQVTGSTAGIADMAAALKGTDDLEGLLDQILLDMDSWGGP